MAKRLRDLGVKGILVRAAELGYITEVKCGMPQCFCPEELGGAGYFVPRTNQWNDWEATLEHYPIAKLDGGRRTVDNAVLAHRLCKQARPLHTPWAVHRERSRKNQKRSRNGRWELMRRAAPSQRSRPRALAAGPGTQRRCVHPQTLNG